LFDVRTLERDGWTVVAVVGEVDLATLPALRQHLETATGERIALDLSGVDHIDPIGFGLVIAGALKARRRGALFAVVCPGGRPRELLAETELDQILTVVDELGDLSD
jgi:anti-anti-sigma factor